MKITGLFEMKPDQVEFEFPLLRSTVPAKRKGVTRAQRLRAERAATDKGAVLFAEEVVLGVGGSLLGSGASGELGAGSRESGLQEPGSRESGPREPVEEQSGVFQIDVQPELKGPVQTIGEGRRYAALVLPQLVLELAWRKLSEETQLRGGTLFGAAHQERQLGQVPFAAVLLQHSSGETKQALDGAELPATAKLIAVSEAAQRYGVRPGQSIAEACALVSNLVVQELSEDELRGELAHLAELSLGFGAIVSFELPDTIWVDITGAAHLRGGEEALAESWVDWALECGYIGRVAIAQGPRIAQALARHGNLSSEGFMVVAGAETKQRLHQLSVVSLPIEPAQISLLVRLGLHSIGDVAALPAPALSSRLGRSASEVLAWCRGVDPELLIPYQPPELIAEERSWDDPLDELEPLGFVLHGLVARVSERLQARGLAAQSLKLSLQHDTAIAELRQVARVSELMFEFSFPLWKENELRRVLKARLSATELKAPVVGMELQVAQLTSAPVAQLNLAQSSNEGGGVSRAPQAAEDLAVLFSELISDLGGERVGVLELVDSHRPELQSFLRGIDQTSLVTSSVRRAPASHRFGATPGSNSRLRRAKRLSSENANQASRLASPIQALLPYENSFNLARLPTRLFAQPLAVACSLQKPALHIVGSPEGGPSRLNGARGGSKGVGMERSVSSERSARAPLGVRPAPKYVLTRGSLLSFGRKLYTVVTAEFESRLDGVEWWSTQPISRDYWRVRLESESTRNKETLDALLFLDRKSNRYFLQGIYD